MCNLSKISRFDSLMSCLFLAVDAKGDDTGACSIIGVMLLLSTVMFVCQLFVFPKWRIYNFDQFFRTLRLGSFIGGESTPSVLHNTTETVYSGIVQ